MNYQRELEEILSKEKNNRPSLLLHVCCSPCSTYVLEYLNKFFNITLYFYNPNIDSNQEYIKRYNEVEKFIKEYPFEEVDIIKMNYDHSEFLEVIGGFELDKEGGIRCSKCIKLRLESAFIYAKINNFDYITTTLTISPYKNANLINSIGKELGEKYQVKYLFSDFKKKNGYKRSIELAKEFNIYRQDYCGCEYSIKKEVDYHES